MTNFEIIPTIRAKRHVGPTKDYECIEAVSTDGHILRDSFTLCMDEKPFIRFQLKVNQRPWLEVGGVGSRSRST